MESVQQRKGQGGFTLVELIAVLVVLGVLAAFAIPRFTDLTDQAEARGIASQISGWAAQQFGSDVIAANGNLEELHGADPIGDIGWGSNVCVNLEDGWGGEPAEVLGLDEDFSSFSISDSGPAGDDDVYASFRVNAVSADDNDQTTVTCYVELD